MTSPPSMRSDTSPGTAIPIDRFEEIWEVCVPLGAHPSDCADARNGIQRQLERHTHAEWRALGMLGFGGKLRANRTRDGIFWHVSAYPEDMNARRSDLMLMASDALAELGVSERDLAFSRRHAESWYDSFVPPDCWDEDQRAQFTQAVKGEVVARGSLDLNLPTFWRTWVGANR